MSSPDRRLHARLGLRTRSCFNGHDVSPAQLCVVEIGTASIVVCGPTCETEARARILLRIHGSLSAAFRQALHDWRSGTGQAGVVLALLDRAVAQAKARDALLEQPERPCARPEIPTIRRWRTLWSRGLAP